MNTSVSISRAEPSPSPVAITLVAAALVESYVDGERRVFLARRSKRANHGGLWELPGGKVEAGEYPADALAREIREELGVGIRIVGEALQYEARLGDRGFAFIVFPSRFRLSKGETLSLRVHDECGYFGVGELVGLELAPLDGPALRDWAGRGDAK